MIAAHHFTHPAALWLLAVVPVALGFLLWGGSRRRRTLRHLGGATGLRAALQARQAGRGRAALLTLLGLGSLVVALAQPRWGRGEGVETRTGRDVVIVLDVSKSMLAEQPSRLERA
ncbi:MAG: hypothetical protein NZO58_01690, partial [Gemmataceae bacterium]|nr:hypothetical protein [Gemmataceae bacterium]